MSFFALGASLLMAAYLILLGTVVCVVVASQPHTGTRVAATAPAPVTALHTPRHAGHRVPAHVEIATTYVGHRYGDTGGYPIIREVAA